MKAYLLCTRHCIRHWEYKEDQTQIHGYYLTSGSFVIKTCRKIYDALFPMEALGSVSSLISKVKGCFSMK
jgi:hypothetical protein